MIPKKIHYCWFGRNPKPALAEKCIASWKKYCPDYEIIEWNEDNFDLDCNGYTRYCYDNKKWAFLSDFVRIEIIAVAFTLIPMWSCFAVQMNFFSMVHFMALRMMLMSILVRALVLRLDIRLFLP